MTGPTSYAAQKTPIIVLRGYSDMDLSAYIKNGSLPALMRVNPLSEFNANVGLRLEGWSSHPTYIH